MALNHKDLEGVVTLVFGTFTTSVTAIPYVGAVVGTILGVKEIRQGNFGCGLSNIAQGMASTLMPGLGSLISIGLGFGVTCKKIGDIK